MVSCNSRECSARATFAVKRTAKPMFCSQHKKSGMIYVCGTMCAHEECTKQPVFGSKGSGKTEFCFTHKAAGMVNIYAKRCAHRGCATRPSFGREGSKKVEFCGKHKGAGMVLIYSPRCAYLGCSDRASYGTERSRKREFCTQHKRAGMVDLNNKRCAYQGCVKYPSFGSEASRKVEFCVRHKGAGMVDVGSKRCAYQGCSKRPSYGTENSRKAEVCGEHRRAGMVTLCYKRCIIAGYAKHAKYGRDGSRTKPFLCIKHLREGHTAVQKAEGTEDARNLGADAGGQVSLPAKRKRAVGVVRSSPQVQQTPESLHCSPSRRAKIKASGMEGRDSSQVAIQLQVPARVQESSPTSIPTGLSLLRSPEGNTISREMQNLSRDNRARSREKRTSTGSGSWIDSALCTEPNSSLGSTKPAQLRRTRGLVHTNKGRGKVTSSTGTTASGDGAPDNGDSGERVETGAMTVSSTSGGVGTGIDISTTSSQGCCHSRTCCHFVLENRRKIATLEEAKREAVVEAKNLRNEVVQLKQQVVDAAVGRAEAVAEAKGEIKEQYKEIVQALRDDVCAATTNLKDNKDVLRVVCAEREALREQVMTANKETAKTEKTKADLHQCMEGLRAELTATSMGWENTKDDLKQKCQERDALQREVTRIEAQVASAAIKIEADAAELEKAKDDFHHRIEAVRTELTAASTGWQNAKDHLQKISQERDILHNELEAQVALHADITFKAAASSEALMRLVKRVKVATGKPLQAQTREIGGLTASGQAEGVVEEEVMDDNVALRDLKPEGAGARAVPRLRSHGLLRVAVKPEG